MRKFLVFDGDTYVELAPLTYEEFLRLELWSGASDMAYQQWLGKNNYADVDSYTEEALAEARIKIVREVPIMFFQLEPDGPWQIWDEELAANSKEQQQSRIRRAISVRESRQFGTVNRYPTGVRGSE